MALSGLIDRLGSIKNMKGTRDGALSVAPWYQVLVTEGRVFGIHAGSVTTPLAGHTGADADQPEAAIRIPDGTVGMPIFANITIETGSTTLGVGGIMLAVSNIDVGAGTSTAATPFNLRIDNPRATAASAAVAYTGNGTDPLTAGNFLELARQGFILDADAATTGIVGARLAYSAHQNVVPLIYDAGSFLAYVEHANNAPSWFGQFAWAEFSEDEI